MTVNLHFYSLTQNAMATLAQHLDQMRSGCGSVGRAVASTTRGPWSESSQWQYFIMTMSTANL